MGKHAQKSGKILQGNLRGMSFGSDTVFGTSLRCTDEVGPFVFL